MHCKCDVKKKVLKVPKTSIDPLSFLFACFLRPNKHNQFCICIVYISLGTIESPKRKSRQCVCKTVCVCWRARNMPTKCIMGNLEMANTHALLSWKNNFMSAPGFSYNFSFLNYSLSNK